MDPDVVVYLLTLCGVGWKYEVSDPIDRKWTLGTKKYAFNFLAENVERKLRKEGPRTKEYVQPTALGTYHITCRWREGKVDETLLSLPPSGR